MGYAVAAAAGLQAIGSVMQGQAAAGAANYNATIAEQNAKLATQNAEWAGAEGEQKVGVEGLQAKAKAGDIKTAQAANNVDVNSGSALAVQQSQRQAALLNQTNTRSNAARQAYGYETQAVAYENQAALDKSQARSDKIGGIIGGLTNVAKGAAGVAQFGGGGGGGDLPAINTFSENPVSTPGGVSSFLGQGGGSTYSDFTMQNVNLFPDQS